MHLPLEQTPKNGGLPIKFFLAPEMMPDAETIAQLQTLSATPGLTHHVAVLPDIHRKSRNLSPTGTVVAAKNMLVPRAVDKGINCGMRILRTDIDASSLHVSALDELFDELRRTIPVKVHEHNYLSEEEVAEILVQGGEWCQKRFGLSDEELDCIENRGTMPTDTTDPAEIVASIPEIAIQKGLRTFCTIGDGNHFLELQEIVEVLDNEVATRLGLAKGKAVFMLHTGSRTLGSRTMKLHLAELEEKFRPAENGFPIWSMPADSEEGVKYARAVAAASNFGFANRIALSEKLREATRKALGDQSLKIPLLYDCAHVSIKQEEWNGEKLWVHRHGASSALPPSHFASHPVYSKTGQPVPIPGSMGHDSYIGVADENAIETFCSVNHGAGRVLDKPEASAQFSEQQVYDEMKAKDIRLYRYGSDNIAEQAPRSFKDISKVIAAMSSLALARPVVRVRPVAVLKG